MALNEELLRRLVETPGVSGREERQREIAREQLGTLTDEVRTDSLGSVIGTRRGSREDVRVMVAAHTDEIGYLVKHVDDKGFLRLHTLGGHDPANMVSQRVVVTTADGTELKGALQPQRKPPHLARGEEQKPPRPTSSSWTSGYPPTRSRTRCAWATTPRWTAGWRGSAEAT